MRRALVPLAAALAAVVLAPPAAAEARGCPSGDLRYPFAPGGPKHFGVLRLEIAGAGCATARRVARGWMRGFERDLRAGRVRVTRTVDGFRFRALRPTEAQTYRLRGRRGAVTIRFSYRVPNG
jgi:hypothetical protein